MDTCVAHSNCEIYFNFLNFELLNKFWCRGNKYWYYVYCGQWFSSTTTSGNVCNNNTKKLISYWIIHKRQLQSQIVIKRVTVKTNNTFPSIFATPTSRCFLTISIPSLHPSPHLFACWNLPQVLQFMQHQTPMWLWTTSLLHLLTW